jgi:type IV secretion system protein VirD4
VIYKLSRLLLIIAILAMVYRLATLVMMTWPASGLIVGFITFSVLRRRRAKHLTLLGSARWAEFRELHRAGLIGGDRGLILGHLLKRPSRAWAMYQLFNRRISAKEACRIAWSRRLPLVRLRHSCHSLVVGPTGSGKGTSFVVPTLLTSPQSAVVVDFKGELASLTARHREKAFHHRTALLDPFRVVTQHPDTFNPLDFISCSSNLAIDESFDLANALVVRTGKEPEAHWNESAEAFIAAVVALIVWCGKPELGLRSLQTVREILSRPEKLSTAIKVMLESNCWGGKLAEMGGQLLHFADKEKSSVLSTTLRHLRFLGTPTIAASTATSSFDPASLRTGKLTVYLILPPDHMRAQSGLLRMWIGSMLRAVTRGGLQE